MPSPSLDNDVLPSIVSSASTDLSLDFQMPVNHSYSIIISRMSHH